MRNLKKVLSLALAMVMLLGMMVVGAGATSFTDDADINHKDAVDVVSGIGVLQGVGDNTFNPEGTLSRAEAAVVIAKLDLGAAFGNLATTNASTFKDVGAGYGWAKPYIDYCAARGLIAGDGNGYFMPDQKVTGVQFALMVARVLGYEDANESIGGADWEVNAAALARKAGLTVDVTLGSEAITRDDMAQVAFNALTADMVEYKQSAITIGDITIPAGKASSVMHKGATGEKTYTDDTAKNTDPMKLCEEKFSDLKLISKDDGFNRPGTEWQYKKEALVFVPSAALLTYTDSVKVADVTKDLKGYSVITGDADYVVDGAAQADLTSIGNIASAVNNKAGKGVTVTVYANDAKEVTDVVVINTYIGQVTKVVTKDGETTTTVSKKVGGSESANTFETDAFAKDDYVLYTVSDDGIETMALAEKVSGKVTATSTGYLRLDGTKYDFAKNTGNKDGVPAVKNEYDLYLAADGSIIYTTKVAAAADEYLYVKGVDKYFDTLSVRVVFADGTTQVVELDGDTMVRSDNTNEGIADADAVNGTPGGSTYVKLSDADDTLMGKLVTGATAISGKAYAYTESDGKYKLTTAAVATGAISEESGQTNQWRYSIEKNNSILYLAKDKSTDTGSNWSGSPDATANASVVANNDTVYVMVDDGKTYTGFRNVPSMDKVSLVYVPNKDNANLVDLVFITKKTDGADDNASYFYIADKSKYEEQDGYTVWKEAYVNGEQVDVMTKGAYDASGAGAVITAPGVYKAEKTNSDGYITTVSSVIATSSITRTATVASGQTLKLSGTNEATSISNSADWTYNDDTLFISVDDEGNVTADNSVPSGIVNASPAAGDTIYKVVVTERKGSSGTDQTTAKVVYVVESEKAWVDVDSITITGVTAVPAKDAAMAAPTTSTTQVEVVSHQWYTVSGGTDTAVDTTGNFAGGTVYKLTITLKIADANANTHRFGTMNGVTIGAKTGVWDAAAKTLTFTFDATAS